MSIGSLSARPTASSTSTQAPSSTEQTPLAPKHKRQLERVADFITGRNDDMMTAVGKVLGLGAVGVGVGGGAAVGALTGTGAGIGALVGLGVVAAVPVVGVAIGSAVMIGVYLKKGSPIG